MATKSATKSKTRLGEPAPKSVKSAPKSAPVAPVEAAPAVAKGSNPLRVFGIALLSASSAVTAFGTFSVWVHVQNPGAYICPGMTMGCYDWSNGVGQLTSLTLLAGVGLLVSGVVLLLSKRR